jgi:hypothetical protein
MVPVVGIELTTYRLQGGCSTTELNRRTGVHYRETWPVSIVRQEISADYDLRQSPDELWDASRRRLIRFKYTELDQ